MRIVSSGFMILSVLPLSAQWEVDKQAHFLAGGVVSMTTGYAAERAGLKHPVLWGIGASVLAGVAKEVYDKQRGGKFDNKDLMATALGGFVFSYTIRW